MRRLATAIALVALALSAPAQAQRTQAAALSAETTVRGVVAQYEAALIRERRLADDRETRLIAANEAAMRAARAQLDQGIAGAQAELEQARAAYAQLTGEIAQRDAAARAEIEVYRAEAQGLAAQASPELLAAYQRFADGDQEGAYPVIAALTQASVRARMAAAGAAAAVQVRQQAEARNIMRLNGRGGATAQEVLALWDQAAELDPQHFDTHIERARLAQAVNDLSRAEAAGRAALTVAATPRERSVALNELGDVLIARNDLEGALSHYREALQIARTLHAADRSDTDQTRDVSVFLERIGDVLIAHNDLDGALSHYRESLEIARALHVADRSNVERARDLAWGLTKVGDALIARADIEGATTHYRESLELRRALSAADRGNAGLAREVTHSLQRVGDVLVARGDADGALSHFRDALEIARALYAADRSNAELARDMMVNLTRIGDVLAARNDRERALAHHRESLEIARALHRADLSNAGRAREFWALLWRMARYGGARWSDVVAAIEDARRLGLFNEAQDQSFLDEARRLAAQER